jgi:hypothetical protein
MGGGTLILAAVLAVIGPVRTASSGLQPYTASNSPATYATTSATFGTATATIQESSAASTTGTWTYCANHAVDGPSCAAAAHLPAGTVSSWVNHGATRLVTLPNGAQCYEHTDAAGVTWCYGGEPVQDSISTTGSPFGTTPDTRIGELPNEGEAWWGSGGGPNDDAACRGMFDNAPTSSQASFASCVSQFGTVTWDTSGGMVASIGSVADEMAWRIGEWNATTQPGGVRCGDRTAIGGTASDSQAPNGLWMQWNPSPARGFWNCTQEDGAAGPPQSSWNGSSWYSRAYADWNGFGWYLEYYDYASFIETASTVSNGVITSISCGGYTSPTTVTSRVPSGVQVSIDESTGLGTFTDDQGTVLSEVSCVNSPTPRTTVPPPPTTPPRTPPPLLASNYSLNVPVGQTGAVNVLATNNFRGVPSLSIVANSPQPGSLDTDPNSVDFGYFTWSPTYIDAERAKYQMCDADGCATGIVFLNSDATPPPPVTAPCQWYCGQASPATSPPPSTPPPSPDVTLGVDNAFPAVRQYVTLTATATNPVSTPYDLKIVTADTGMQLIDCGQRLSCSGYDSAGRALTRHYVATLSYSSAATDYSNEVTVTWGASTVGLTACLSPAPCPSTSITPAGGSPAFLTATVYNAPSEPNNEPVNALFIVDAVSHQVVGQCTPGETVCQIWVTEPGGTSHTYVADWVTENNPQDDVFSNTVAVNWTAAPSTTLPPTVPPTTTTSPPTTTPTTAPPTTTPVATTTTVAPGPGGLEPTARG